MDFLSELQQAGSSSVCDDPISPTPNTVLAEVKFKNLYPGKVFYKDQYRRKGWIPESRQLVIKKQRLVHMEARTNAQLYKIYGWVKRKNAAAFHDNNGEVPLKNEDTGEILNLIKDTDRLAHTEDGFLQPFTVDLHGIYSGNIPNKPVFELSKSDVKLNEFQLVVQLEFIDNSLSEKFTSPTFILQTKDKPPVAEKRPRPDDSPSTSRGTGSQSEEQIQEQLDREERRHEQILVDVLDAKTANVEKLVAKNVHFGGRLNVETEQADLAYHLTLKDPDQFVDDLDEGDIVGFFNDESGETYIEPLRHGNIHNAIHAGVVSRSHWLAGHKPQNPDTKTDTVCVIGIVNVKVVGSIENGERIYASSNNPGKAIPQSYMPVGSFLRKKHVLLGMALETKKCTTMLDDVQLVKCFVCIVLDVNRRELFDEIEELYEVNEKRTREEIRNAHKRTWKKLKCYSIAVLLSIGLAICILYQWLVPGSMFRYWLCRRGSVPNHELFYHYKNEALNRDFPIHGIEFTYEGLQDKVGISFSRNTKIKDDSKVTYYLNVDRCAYYWADGAAGNNIGGRKYIGGSRILSVNQNCSVVYRLDEGEDVWNKVLYQTGVNCTTGQ
ncbi:uncharacterized protein LOC114537548 isoform X2 [Dendronephthya gigantea]|uniref:uncharacterized protein LOC114537548 isoform X2 n=1 Tax=Dendronephthya gigantea TaxID=151771 RepID=UPI001068D67C|nr:uncharacterized protein LOC114537548 isoform X2 [Dendronephthya gigantea]